MWAGKWDETRQALCFEEKQWPATSHGIPWGHTHTWTNRHTHTNAKHPPLPASREKRLKGDGTKQVKSFLFVFGLENLERQKRQRRKHALHWVSPYNEEATMAAPKRITWFSPLNFSLYKPIHGREYSPTAWTPSYSLTECFPKHGWDGEDVRIANRC